MKKNLLFYFFMGLMILCISPVNAKDAVYKEWETPESLISDLENGYEEEDGDIIPFITLRDNNYEFNHGYVASRIEYQMTENMASLTTYLTYYDKDGNEVYDEDYEYTIILSAVADGEYLYTFAFDLMKEEYVLSKLDTKLKTVEELEVTDLIVVEDENGNNNFSEILIFSLLPKFVGYNSLSVVGEEVALLYGTEEFLKTDLDLDNATINTFNNDKLKKYFPALGLESEHIMSLEEQIENSETGLPETIYLFTDGGGDYLTSGGLKLGVNENIDLEHGFVYPLDSTEPANADVGSVIEDNDPYQDYLEFDAKLGLFDTDYNLKWEVVNTDYAVFFDTHFVGNYVVTIGLNIDMPEGSYDNFVVNEELMEGISNIQDIGDVVELVGTVNNTVGINTDILIYDLEGNLVQTIHGDDNLFINLHPAESGFITTNIGSLNEYISTPQGVNGTVATNDIPVTMSTEVWHLSNNIVTEIKGEGTVNVVQSSRPGDPVTFVVEPQEGYVLSVIKVTDENGNVVTFTDNTFTMPNANVTIEAVFIKNPETADIAVIAMVIIFAGVLVLGYKYRKKLNWLK